MAETETITTAPYRFLSDQFATFKFDDEGIETKTSEDQEMVENSVLKCYDIFKNFLGRFSDIPLLERQSHTSFLLNGLKSLSKSYECLDGSRPWLCYWILHSLELLEVPIAEDRAIQIAEFIGKCQDSEGGFGGGPGQVPHLAPTYAAVNSLCILSNITERVFDVLNREKLHSFLMRLRTEDGAFRMHEDGEVDIRGLYCACSAARLTNIMTKELFDGTAEYIQKCQTYEGGFSGIPGMEAHGGYSFCGLAALVLLNRTDCCDLDALLRWTAFRQTKLEGGFQGRTNKLVDGCYSFWQGGVFPIIHIIKCNKQNDPNLNASRWFFNQEALQEYILICCQHMYGGLIDKPGKTRDYYHTCYCLSGLSAAQHVLVGHLSKEVVVGNPDNKLRALQPVFNLTLDSVFKADQHFGKMEVPSSSSSSSSSSTSANPASSS